MSKPSKDSMKDLAAQKQAYLESELNQVRHTIRETKEWGYDTIEMTMDF